MIRRRLEFVLAGAVATLLLAGCSAIGSGEITAKNFVPEHGETTTSCHLIGRFTYCTPRTITVADSWSFDLYDGQQTGWVDVSEVAFDSYEVGDWYYGGSQ